MLPKLLFRIQTI